MSDIQKEAPIRSPCVGVCCPGDNDLCSGCLRNAMEIAEWGVLSNDEKREVLELIRRRAKGEIC